ncbi:CLUMA_CG011720, isoform A [Clunio marinus]|uniref:CLUMA_CG011720, isoform A n=1 Tax=Clunio marinus TaxID=568069 RepID=A0A1J1IDR6_9DIPT|nr:CLUMA_CG011720, isoform A [Clunio marinus]
MSFLVKEFLLKEIEDLRMKRRSVFMENLTEKIPPVKVSRKSFNENVSIIKQRDSSTTNTKVNEGSIHNLNGEEMESDLEEKLKATIDLYNKKKFKKEDVWTNDTIDLFHKLTKHNSISFNFAGQCLEVATQLYIFKLDSLYQSICHLNVLINKTDLSRNEDNRGKRFNNKSKTKKSKVVQFPETLNAKLQMQELSEPFFAKLNTFIGENVKANQMLLNFLPHKYRKLGSLTDAPFWDCADEKNANTKRQNVIKVKQIPSIVSSVIRFTNSHYRITNQPIKIDYFQQVVDLCSSSEEEVNNSSEDHHEGDNHNDKTNESIADYTEHDSAYITQFNSTNDQTMDVDDSFEEMSIATNDHTDSYAMPCNQSNSVIIEEISGNQKESVNENQFHGLRKRKYRKQASVDVLMEDFEKFQSSDYLVDHATFSKKYICRNSKHLRLSHNYQLKNDIFDNFTHANIQLNYPKYDLMESAIHSNDGNSQINDVDIPSENLLTNSSFFESPFICEMPSTRQNNFKMKELKRSIITLIEEETINKNDVKFSVINKKVGKMFESKYSCALTFFSILQIASETKVELKELEDLKDLDINLINNCPHLQTIVQINPVELSIQKKGKLCSNCPEAGPNLWICLRCMYIGCSDKHNDHSTLHFETTRHSVQMNLSSQRVWCYLCECEVFIHNQTNRFHQRTNSIDSTEGRRIFQYHQDFTDRGVTGEATGSFSSSDYDDEDCEQTQLNGLVGLKNIANTCYMNSALQALSNSRPLTGFFLECGSLVQHSVPRTKIGLAKSYHRLIKDMWLHKRRGYIVPVEIIRGISTIHPMFRGYQQHDTQEFLRCFMDQLHEELKEVTPPPPEFTDQKSPVDELNQEKEDSLCPSPSSQSEAEYETCDSGVSEQSSLSDEVTNTKRTRKFSRSPSPPAHQRLNNNATNSSSSIPTIGSSILSNRTGSNTSLTSQPSSGNQQQIKENINNNQQQQQQASKVIHRSIISDVFDGKLLSSVQCLTCDRVSTREETFQDLSLPIPGRDHLAVLHLSQNPPPLNNINSSLTMNGVTSCTDVVYQVQDSWIWWLWSWFRSFFWGPAVNLHDCMGAFFSADELKGDNMYSCEKCNKLRNGIKFSRVLALPEMLCVHLKRFRHDLSYSSKISSPVIFPLTGLDMRQYLHKDCKSQVSTYDLSAVICHHGTVGSGHYICYAKHAPTDKWFEFDDQTVSQVSAETVQNCEAYVLFYQKSNPQMSHIRAQAQEIINSHPQAYLSSPTDIKFFVSKQWINRFHTFAEPGPIDNSSILCQHGSLLPNKSGNVRDLLVPINQTLWDFMYEKFGGGPVCNHPIECDTCKTRAEDLERRQKNEMRIFSELRDEFQYPDSSSMLFAISMNWFRKWQAFAHCETNEEPGPITNITIAQQSDTLPIRNTPFNMNMEQTVIAAKDIENDRPIEKEKTSILKPTKTVSFEDTSDIHNDESEADEHNDDVAKEVTKTNQKERQVETINGSASGRKTTRKFVIKPIEINLRDKRHHRSSEQSNLFGAQGTIRHIPDEEICNGSSTTQQVKANQNQKPKRNGNDSDSDEENQSLTTEIRVNGHDMMPWMMPYLRYVDDSLKSSFQESLSLMRKNRLFCDVILHVENTEIHAHRNVLACVSPYLMELFSAEQNTCNDGNIPSFRLNGYITKEGLNILVDYAYTAKLEVPDDMIKPVYLAAWQLRMERVVNECAAHLVSDLSNDTCIETRSLPGINRNKTFVSKVDKFIADHFPELSQTTSFLQLPSIQIEVLHQTKQEMAMVAEDSLSRLVLDWIRREMNEHFGSIASLSERSHMLFLGLDNSLQDAADLVGDKANSDMVKDYKKLASKNPSGNPKSRRKHIPNLPERPRILIYSRDITDRSKDEENRADADWNLIGTTKVFDHMFISLVTLNGALCRVSIQLRLNEFVPSSETSSGMTTPSPVALSVESDGKQQQSHQQQPPFDLLSIDQQITQLLQPELFCEVATMSESKCGLGVAELEGKLIVVGGYGRAECLRSVESYDPAINEWTQQLSLSEARGRVQIAVINGTIYAVGGCNGTTELDTVECLALGERVGSGDEKPKKWRKCSKLPFSRSNAGVCALNGKIYCIGGWNGQSGIKQCDVYCPETDQWTSIAPLNTGRCQAGVFAFNKKIWVVGGSDAWNCLGTVETYDPETNQWTFSAPLLTPRRGCGLAELKGRLYCVGGSDGNQSLKSSEYFDEATQSWILGPSLTTARSIVSVVVVQNRLYAIGGFSGKKFLNTIEYYDEDANEWTKFAKLQQTNSSIDSNGSVDDNLSAVDSNGDMMRDLELDDDINTNHRREDKISEDESNTIIMPKSIC